MPSLTVTESAGQVRLQLGAIARGEGASLQDAADDLIRPPARPGARRSGRAASRVCSEARPDLETLDFLYELGEIAAAGGDIREHVFG